MAVKKVSEQMEMFEDGGLKDEGGTIDPVSGNDVPPGSTQEEVRDDIPAQLSEGEFVFPADVTRFIGLEKLMMMRQEAKMGLKKMEDMGQMGNSEEATMSDDMPFNSTDIETDDDTPFSLEDLEMEDDSKEMAEGGYVMVEGKPMPIPMIGGQLPPITTRPMPETKNMAVGGLTNTTGTYQVPTNIATQPSYFQNYQQSTAPFRPFVPQNVGTQPPSNTAPVAGQVPTFGELMPQLTGKRETLEYRNDAGQKLFIPFINGKPIYPIPEGYTRYIAEEVTTPVKPTNVQSTSVRQDTGDGGDSNVLSGTNTVRGLDNSIVSTNFTNMSTTDVAKSMGNMSSTDRASAVQNAMQTSYGYTGLAKGMQQLGAAVVPGVLAGKMYGQKTMNPMDVLGQIGQPDMGARDAISTAFGYDEKGYDMDDPMDASLAGIDQQNAINTAIFGGLVTGKEGKTRGGIQGITVADIQKEYGIAPSYTSRGNKDVQIEIGTNPGQMMNGVFYDVNGIGNSDDAAYSSLNDMMGYLSVSIGKHGYYGTLKTAKEQAKKGNKIAIAVVKDMKIKEKYGKDVDVDAISDRSFGDDKSGTGPGPGDGGAPTGDPDDDDTASQGDNAATDTGVGAGVGMGSVSTEEANENEDGPNADNDGDTPGDSQGSSGGVGDYNIGGLAGKKKKKPKPKKMKRGGLASR